MRHRMIVWCRCHRSRLDTDQGPPGSRRETGATQPAGVDDSPLRDYAGPIPQERGHDGRGRGSAYGSTGQGFSHARSGRRFESSGRSCRCSSRRIRTFSRIGRAAWARCQAPLLSMRSGDTAVARLRSIVDLHHNPVRRQERAQTLTVDDAHVEHLPGSFSSLVAARLKRQRHQVLRIDHPHRHTVVVQRPRRCNCGLGQRVVGRKELDGDTVNEDVLGINWETKKSTAVAPPMA